MEAKRDVALGQIRQLVIERALDNDNPLKKDRDAALDNVKAIVTVSDCLLFMLKDRD